MDKASDKATFAAGCFWGVEAYFKRIHGVIATRVGYIGGEKASPTYEDVCTGKTGHAEAIEIVFDPSIVTFGELLGHFWMIHDPTSLNKQGGDSGTQYRSAIFFHDNEQANTAMNSRTELDNSGTLRLPIATEIVEASRFWPAEEYHQDYLTKNPGGYCHIPKTLFEK